MKKKLTVSTHLNEALKRFQDAKQYSANLSCAIDLPKNLFKLLEKIERKKDEIIQTNSVPNKNIKNDISYIDRATEAVKVLANLRYLEKLKTTCEDSEKVADIRLRFERICGHYMKEYYQYNDPDGYTYSLVPAGKSQKIFDGLVSTLKNGKTFSACFQAKTGKNFDKRKLKENIDSIQAGTNQMVFLVVYYYNSFADIVRDYKGRVKVYSFDKILADIINQKDGKGYPETFKEIKDFNKYVEDLLLK